MGEYFYDFFFIILIFYTRRKSKLVPHSTENARALYCIYKYAFFLAKKKPKANPHSTVALTRVSVEG